MKRKIALLLLIVFAIIQFSAIGSRILKYENILETGKVWKLEVKPVDPYDVLRGRFVRLRFKKDILVQEFPKEEWRINKPGYVFLVKDKEGFAYPKEWVKEQPENDLQNYIKCSLTSWYNLEKFEWKVVFPFDRFFMNEYKAPQAEKVMRSSFLENHKVYITLRVKAGIGVIEDLWVDDLTISQYLDESNNNLK